MTVVVEEKPRSATVFVTNVKNCIRPSFWLELHINTIAKTLNDEGEAFARNQKAVASNMKFEARHTGFF